MTIHPLHTPLAAALAVLAAVAVAAVCFRARLLTSGGALAAAVVGAAVFVCGGAGGALALLTFFITSNLLGRFRRAHKERLAFEKSGRRDAWQVLANGGLAAAALVVACIPHAPAPALRAAFLAALAEANADTWATEIGAGMRAPTRRIIDLRLAAPGESGAVSLPGTLAALAGAALIGVCAALGAGTLAWLIVTLAGFAGALVDSVLGATLQAHYAGAPGAPADERLTERATPGARLARGVHGINNDAVNALATLAAALISFGLFAALAR